MDSSNDAGLVNNLRGMISIKLKCLHISVKIQGVPKWKHCPLVRSQQNSDGVIRLWCTFNFTFLSKMKRNTTSIRNMNQPVQENIGKEKTINCLTNNVYETNWHNENHFCPLTKLVIPKLYRIQSAEYWEYKYKNGKQIIWTANFKMRQQAHLLILTSDTETWQCWCGYL